MRSVVHTLIAFACARVIPRLPRVRPFWCSRCCHCSSPSFSCVVAGGWSVGNKEIYANIDCLILHLGVLWRCRGDILSPFSWLATITYAQLRANCVKRKQKNKWQKARRQNKVILSEMINYLWARCEHGATHTRSVLMRRKQWLQVVVFARAMDSIP